MGKSVKRRTRTAPRYFVYVDFVDGAVVVNARLPKKLSQLVNMVTTHLGEHLHAAEAARATETGN